MNLNPGTPVSSTDITAIESGIKHHNSLSDEFKQTKQ
jgi:hypothetical protein